MKIEIDVKQFAHDIKAATSFNWFAKPYKFGERWGKKYPIVFQSWRNK